MADDANNELVGISEAARRLKARGQPIDKSTLSRHVQLGNVRRHGDDPAKPLVRVSEVIEDLATRTDQSKRRGPTGPLSEPEEVDDDAAAPRPETEAEGDLAEMAGGGSAGGDDKKPKVSFAQAKTALAIAQANTAALELARRRGEVLDRGDVLDAFRDLGIQTRTALRQAAAALAQELIGLTDPAEIAAKINASNAKVQDKLADDLRQRFNPVAEQRAAG